MNIYLIGYRGSGKSTVAPLLASELGWEHQDSDDEIQILTGQTIADIFATQGEAGFREWETTVVQALAQKQDLVISLGGGAPTVSAIAELILHTGSAVYLKASAEELSRRIEQDHNSLTNRPQLSELTGLAEVKKMLAARESIYDRIADYTVDTTDKSPQQIANQIATWWDPVDM